MISRDDLSACLLLCRPGLESDCAAEIVERATGHGVHGWCRTGDGRVELHAAEPGGIARLADRLRFTELVFARQWLGIVARAGPLATTDRVTPLVREIAESGIAAFGELRIEHADSADGRPLARLARALLGPLLDGLQAAGIDQAGGRPTLHIFLEASDQAVIGLSDPANASPWPGGIPRLRLPSAAPSRSVLKLDEALGLFLGSEERAAWLRPGRRAVDLGAAPGGWSWLLLERGLKVEAVDNARLAPAVAGHPRLTHHRADGFTWRPRGQVDWLVCDMVARPHRIAALTAAWLERGDCRHALVNLKLPMKRRWSSAREHLATLAAALPPGGRLSARQLYHDRHEITVFATRTPL